MPQERVTQDVGGKPIGYAGSESGKGKKYDEIAEQTDWDAFKKERKLSFAASKAKFAPEFKAWRASKEGKKAGQKKAAGTIAAAE
jgi:hypothetical protein